MAGFNGRQALGAQVDVGHAEVASLVRFGDEVAILVPVIDDGLAAGRLLHPLAVAVIGIGTLRGTALSYADQAVVLIVGQIEIAPGDHVAGRIVTETKRCGSIDGRQAVSIGFIGIGIGLTACRSCEAVADLVVGEAYRTIDAGGTGKAVEIVIAKGLIAGGIQQVVDGGDIACGIMVESKFKNTGRLDTDHALLLIEHIRDHLSAAQGHAPPGAKGLVFDVLG